MKFNLNLKDLVKYIIFIGIIYTILKIMPSKSMHSQDLFLIILVVIGSIFFVDCYNKEGFQNDSMVQSLGLTPGLTPALTPAIDGEVIITEEEIFIEEEVPEEETIEIEEPVEEEYEEEIFEEAPEEEASEEEASEEEASEETPEETDSEDELESENENDLEDESKSENESEPDGAFKRLTEKEIDDLKQAAENNYNTAITTASNDSSTKRIMKNNQNRRSYCIRNILILMKKESVHQNY